MNDATKHVYRAPSKMLISFPTGGGGPITKRFRVPMPDPRLRVKIAVLFVPAAGGPVNAQASGTNTIWLYEGDKDRSALSAGNVIPTTNIEGTPTTPTTISGADANGGYSREFVTAADYIEGVLVSTAGGPMVGAWVLQVDYWPNQTRFTDAEWQEIVSRCVPQVTGGLTVVS